ncbi:MAG TPA: helix-turn-helix transcriptional regulator [Phycisphaerales bacterium]|nr:helix-turn-helix transcriptional regulator [Phycisphaerales bacterium]
MDYAIVACKLAAMAKSKRRKTIYSNDYEELLELLREGRRRTGVQQTELAAKLKITQSSVSKFELGERIMDPVLLRDWCKALGVDFVKLVGEWDRRLG